MPEDGTSQVGPSGERTDLSALIWWARLLGWFAVLFGLLSLVAAGSVFLGARDAGYPAARP